MCNVSLTAARAHLLLTWNSSSRATAVFQSCGKNRQPPYHCFGRDHQASPGRLGLEHSTQLLHHTKQQVSNKRTLFLAGHVDCTSAQLFIPVFCLVSLSWALIPTDRREQLLWLQLLLLLADQEALTDLDQSPLRQQ